ncbi:hypothetical protein R3P38DRAFT_2784887 [Favolaschia claudopus]|uniref:Uncharacterized protein n=1 Tax=Favolaschia claudopus TaxID=2862362 RepID=A0AAW0AVI2_9AGAR
MSSIDGDSLEMGGDDDRHDLAKLAAMVMKMVVVMDPSTTREGADDLDRGSQQRGARGNGHALWTVTMRLSTASLRILSTALPIPPPHLFSSPLPTHPQSTYVGGQSFALPSTIPIPSSFSFAYTTAPAPSLLRLPLASSRATRSRRAVDSVSSEVRRKARAVVSVSVSPGSCVNVERLGLMGLEEEERVRKQKNTPPRTISEAAMLAPTAAAIAVTVPLLVLVLSLETLMMVAVGSDSDAETLGRADVGTKSDADETADEGREESLMKPEENEIGGCERKTDRLKEMAFKPLPKGPKSRLGSPRCSAASSGGRQVGVGGHSHGQRDRKRKARCSACIWRRRRGELAAGASCELGRW